MAQKKYVLMAKYFDGQMLHNKGKIVSFEEGEEPTGSYLYVKLDDTEEEVSMEELIEREETKKRKALEKTTLKELTPKTPVI